MAIEMIILSETRIRKDSVERYYKTGNKDFLRLKIHFNTKDDPIEEWFDTDEDFKKCIDKMDRIFNTR